MPQIAWPAPPVRHCGEGRNPESPISENTAALHEIGIRQQEAERFLRALVQSADILIVPNESRWTGKANHLMRFSDSRRRVISKVFRSLYSDSERALRVWPESTEAIPIETLTLLPDEDVYLVSAYLSANADVLVTADVPLYESLADSDLVTCQMRDDFLGNYRR